MIKRLLHIVVFTLLVVYVHAQDLAEVKAQGRVIDGKIKLRWGVTTPLGWHYAKKYGFTIDRSTVLVNGEVVDNRVIRTLTNEPLKPALLPDWESHMDDDYVAIAAQAIYGEAFEPEVGNSTMVQMMNQAKELENRFSFLMFACDQSVEAARLAGLYHEDEQIHTGEKYLYRIYCNAPTEVYSFDTAAVYIGLDDYVPLPAPRDVEVAFEDHAAMVSWNSSLYAKYYNAFWVERSDDGGQTFRRISKKPVVATVKEEGSLKERTYKVDSLAENGVKYLYRVLGISAFGELSLPSDTVGGAGIPAFKYSPVIHSHQILESGEVRLSWSFPEKYSHLVKEFSLMRQRGDKSGYDSVRTGLPSGKYECVDKAPLSSNYYVLQAWDNYGRVTASFPYLVQLEDSIPPPAPVNLRGSIDTTGRVTLVWDPVEASDLYGYKVYKSNFEDGEFIQVPGAILTENSYEEEITLKTLTESIFYRIKALDRRYNPSEYSVPLKLKKPDVIPPVAPLLTRVGADSAGILVQWQRSPSDDVLQYLVYRQAQSEQDWTLAAVIRRDDNVTYYYDRDLKTGLRYAYTLVAVDDDGLESAPTAPLIAAWKPAGAHPEVTGLDYSIDPGKREIRISWVYAEKEVAGFRIYKAYGEGGFQLFRELPASQRVYVDSYAAGTRVISYKLLAVMKDGGFSEMSEKLIVKP